MNINDILGHFHGVRQNGKDDWFALCPAHADSNSSLHITSDSGRTIMKCMAGCETRDVLAAAGLAFRDLFDGPSSATTSVPAPKYGCTLDEYCQAKRLRRDLLLQWQVTDGQRLSKAGKSHPGVRMAYLNAEGKGVAVRWRMCLAKNTGQGGQDLRFAWDKGDKPCLYGLWRLGEWPKDAVILVEGESDCHSLWSAGFPALGLPGAGNYKPIRDDRWLDLFRRIFVVIERDKGGEKLFSHLSASAVLAGKLRYFCVPGAKDSSEAWCQCQSVEEFCQLMRNGMALAKPAGEFVRPDGWQRQEPAAEDAGGDRRAATSAANGALGGRPKADLYGAAMAYAARLRDNHGHWLLRHWHEAWWRYDGRKYVMVMDSDVESATMAFLQEPGVAEAYNVSPSRGSLQNLISNLKSDSLCSVHSAVQNNTWLDSGQDGSGWGTWGNAIINVREAAAYQRALNECGGCADQSEYGRFMVPLSPDFLSTAAHDYPYDPDADCPKFRQFLKDVAPSEDVQRTLRQMFGACLVPECFDKAFILYGDAGTGKSTCLRILKMVVGQDNCCVVPLLDLSEKFRLWPLAERLVNVVEELATDDPLGKMRYVEGDFKNQVTGGMITVERKGKDVSLVRCMAKHVFATNVLPTFWDKSSGVWDRIVIVPFMQRIRGTPRQIMGFEETLEDELPGILNWALAGLGELLANGGRFDESQECLELKQDHRDRCDQDGMFIRENFWMDAAGEVEVSRAYEAYVKFLCDQGLARRSSVTFQAAMQRVLGVKAKPRSKADRTRVFKGIGMTSSLMQQNAL